jgi:hypothetical protein
MSEMALFAFRQPGQLHTIGGVNGQMLGLDTEFHYRTDELVGLAHPRRAEAFALESH